MHPADTFGDEDFAVRHLLGLLKRLTATLPHRVQHAIKRQHYAWLIRTGQFLTAEDQEYARLHEWVRPGDWVLDIGANIGTYTARLAALVGPSGRVIALEPVPETFALLVANMARYPFRNITLLNAAASDHGGLCAMTVPRDHGIPIHHMANVDDGGEFSVLRLVLDRLAVPRVSLIKIDVEGHEWFALRGLSALLERDHPTLIVEGSSPEVAGLLSRFGYVCEHAPGSPNRVFRSQDQSAARPALARVRNVS